MSAVTRSIESDGTSTEQPPTIGHIFKNASKQGDLFIVNASRKLTAVEVTLLSELLETPYAAEQLFSTDSLYVGPRQSMVTPDSTNAVDIAHRSGLTVVTRIEKLRKDAPLDPLLNQGYSELSPTILTISAQKKPTEEIDDIATYALQHGLALSTEEVSFLEDASRQLNRPLTDAELFLFAQVNSEHCRHKIFNGSFDINGVPQPGSLFSHIKATTKANGTFVVSAYTDNAALMDAGVANLFECTKIDAANYTFGLHSTPITYSLKAETHNWPTQVEPFAGAATGSGGEIRDRLCVGTAGIPWTGTAVYMAPYSRLFNAPHHKTIKPRAWKYQTPENILIKASNGASAFNNEFGQPVICGSVYTFEGKYGDVTYGFDKPIMLAGGIGATKLAHAKKHEAAVGDKIVLLGGSNYRIGIGGGSASSLGTGALANEVALASVQRANPVMQNLAAKVIRALSEMKRNPIKLIHDMGAGGIGNCFTELVEGIGGTIEMSKLPIGDPTLSDRDIISNESQERFGLVIAETDIPLLLEIAKREGCPCFVVGEIDGSDCITFKNDDGSAPVALPLSILLGSSPKTIITDHTVIQPAEAIECAPSTANELKQAIFDIYALEGVGCKQWLTIKADRSVTGRVAQQQEVGPLQLPLANLGIIAKDFTGTTGIATSLGQAPAAAILDSEAGSRLSIARALTNIVWAPLTHGLDGVTLSANWMWAAKSAGEGDRLYRAVQSYSKACIELGIPVPTGKDSLSMSTKYPDGTEVRGPGTVITSAASNVANVQAAVTPDLKPEENTTLLYINLSSIKNNPLGGSAYAQTKRTVGDIPADIADIEKFKLGFKAIQELILRNKILAGHDVASGGLVTTLTEMAFGGNCGLSVDLSTKSSKEASELLMSEKPGVVLQISNQDLADIQDIFTKIGLEHIAIGTRKNEDSISITAGTLDITEPLSAFMNAWYKPSHHLDRLQTRVDLADLRAASLRSRPMEHRLPKDFDGYATTHGVDIKRTYSSGIKAAIIREKGTNGDREMAFALYAAGFDVREITMTDLVSGDTTLDDVNFIVLPGGFSYGDTLGSGKGWAATFKHNAKAKAELDKFFARDDTLSLGVCNGCQAMVALDAVNRDAPDAVEMLHNDSGRFESKFTNVVIGKSKNVLLQGLEGSELGVWIAHGEGKFKLAEDLEGLEVPITYPCAEYPVCPNGSDRNAAAVSSKDGRHLAMMPHPERAIFPWQWAYKDAKTAEAMPEITPWMMMFVNARNWVDAKVSVKN